MRQQFQIVREEVIRIQNTKNVDSEEQRDTQKNLESFYNRLIERYESHAKELERLKKKLKETTSQSERERLEKEIAELEAELESMKDIVQQMEELIRDLSRRTLKITQTFEKT